MKLSTFVLSWVIALPCFGASKINFVCEVLRGNLREGGETTVLMQGQIVKVADNNYELSSQMALHFHELSSPLNLGEEERLANNPAYKPTKYKDHLQFKLAGFKSESVELIYPKFDKQERKDELEAHLQIHNFGNTASGTLHLSCSQW